MSECTRCKGNGRERGHSVLRFADGHCEEHPYDRACDVCGGTGDLSEADLERIAAGKACKRERLAAGRSMFQEAERRGLSVIELSAFERGTKTEKAEGTE